MQITIDPQAMLLTHAVEKTEYALRSLTEHTPPLLNLAAHGLMMAIEHVSTLQAIEDGNRKANKVQASRAARLGAA